MAERQDDDDDDLSDPCGGKDCSKYKLELISNPKLVSIQPAPAAGDKARVELEAQTLFRKYAADGLAMIRDLNRTGDLIGIILTKFMSG